MYRRSPVGMNTLTPGSTRRIAANALSDSPTSTVRPVRARCTVNSLPSNYREWGEPLAVHRSGRVGGESCRTHRVHQRNRSARVHRGTWIRSSDECSDIRRTQLVVGSDGYPAAGILLDLVQEWHSCPSSSEIVQSPRDSAAVTALHHGKYRSDPDSARNKEVRRSSDKRKCIPRPSYVDNHSGFQRLVYLAGAAPALRRSAGRRSDTRVKSSGSPHNEYCRCLPEGRMTSR